MPWLTLIGFLWAFLSRARNDADLLHFNRSVGKKQCDEKIVGLAVRSGVDWQMNCLRFTRTENERKRRGGEWSLSRWERGEWRLKGCVEHKPWRAGAVEMAAR